MNNSDKIYIVIPVFNDRPTIAAVISELRNEGYKDIIVVDDGSLHSIYQEIKHLDVHFLRHRVNLGQGAALKTGFLYAQQLNADIVVTFDADGQHDAKDIQAMLEPVIKGEADVTLGSRFLEKNNAGIKLRRIVLLKLARFVNFIFTGILLSDAHNGLRVLARSAVSLIDITENRMAHASEILFEIKKHGLNYKEVGVNVRYTPYSQTKGQSGWNSVRILLDLIIYKIVKK